MFRDLFTTYYDTDPPPIVTNDHKIIRDAYDPYIAQIILPSTRQEENISFSEETHEYAPLKVQTQPIETPVVLDEPQQSSSEKAVDIARQFIGTKYSWGGTTPNTGFDCSGLVKYAYSQAGIELPRTAKELSKVGTKVDSLDDVQVGDLICSQGSGPSGNHVQMVSRIQNGQIYTIEAKGKKYGVGESPLSSTKKVTTIRRVSKEEPTKKGFAKTMYRYLYQALENNGLDGKVWAPILTAHTTIESDWGNQFSRKNNNYAGIKGKGSSVVGTKEWSPQRGYYTIKDSFKSYPSIAAFADDFVKRLKNKFRAFEGTPQQYVSNIRKHGYFTDSLSHYQGMMNSRLNTINRLLSS